MSEVGRSQRVGRCFKGTGIGRRVGGCFLRNHGLSSAVSVNAIARKEAAQVRVRAKGKLQPHRFARGKNHGHRKRWQNPLGSGKRLGPCSSSHGHYRYVQQPQPLATLPSLPEHTGARSCSPFYSTLIVDFPPLSLRAQPSIPERIATSRLIITLSHDCDRFFCDHCPPVHTPDSL